MQGVRAHAEPRAAHRRAGDSARISHVAALACLVLQGISTTTAHAAEWQRGAAISLSSYFTDNICRTNLQKQDEIVHTATPTVRVSGSGGRARLSLDAALQYNSLGQLDLDCPRGGFGLNNNVNTFVPRGTVRGELDLVEDWLTLDANATASQNRVNPFLPGGEDAVDGSNNSNTTYQYGAAATVRRRLAGEADLLLRYGYDEQINVIGALGDSQQETALFTLANDPARRRLSLGVDASYSDVAFQGRNPAFGGNQAEGDAQLASASLGALLQVNRVWELNAAYGEEWNDFVSVFQDNDGSFWDVGFRWSPSTRVTVEGGWGERFFGSTPRGSIDYSHKHSNFRLAYERSVNTNRNLRVLGLLDDGLVLDPDLPLNEQGIPTGAGNTVLINEQLLASYSLRGRRSELTATASDSQQTRAIDGGESRFRNTIIELTRALNSTLRMRLRLSWDERENLASTPVFFGPDSETWGVLVDATRDIGTRTSLRLAYGYLSRESDALFNNFDENRVTLTLNHRFR